MQEQDAESSMPGAAGGPNPTPPDSGAGEGSLVMHTSLLGELVIPDGVMALRLALDHAEGGKTGEAKLARVAPIGEEQPVHVVADGVGAGFDAAAIGIDGGCAGSPDRRGIGKDLCHRGMGGGPVLL